MCVCVRVCVCGVLEDCHEEVGHTVQLSRGQRHGDVQLDAAVEEADQDVQVREQLYEEGGTLSQERED